MRLELNGQWHGVCYGESGEEFTFTGSVPGCVHTDLAGSRLPADLYYRDHADLCRWVEDRDWVYERTFTLESVPQGAELVFEGLDTYADVYLNGRLLGSADDMFIPWRFAASGLRQGENTLRVYFRSPVRQVADRPWRKASFGAYGRLYTRRLQCTYGWDWVARFVTCGIFREVYLEAREGFGVKNVYICSEHICGDSAQISVEAEFENYEQGGFAELEIRDPRGRVVYFHRWFRKEGFLKEYIDIPDAELWWPTGYGTQPLYTLTLCGKQWRFGIRTVQIRQLPDAPGSPYWETCLAIQDSPSGRRYDHNEAFSGFELLINGVAVMCKGANWVPSEPFPSAETPEKITHLLQLAREAGVNMLRVWGGGIFEQEHFYAQCDALGILVTQDFLMACGQYPEEEPWFLEALRKETEHAALTLRNHPCLMWWSGDNENAVNGSDEAEDYRGRAAIHQGIWPVLNRLDPKRRFLPSSPFGGKVYASKTVGTTHNTQYLGVSLFPFIMQTEMGDYKEHFASYLARFIAEEPTCGAACLPSLKRFMTEEDIFDSDAMWQYHTKSNPALSFTLFDMQLRFAQKILGDFSDGHDRYFKLKYCQYEWIRISMENIRRNRGFCNGIVYWMWNDCWPASSGWSFVDYFGLPKAAFYSFKRCAGALLSTIDKQDCFRIHLCNDSLETKTVQLTIYALSGDGLRRVTEAEVNAGAACAQVALALPLGVLPAGGMLICDAACGQVHDRSFYREGKLPILPCEGVSMTRKGSSITVTAQSYVHAVELEGEYIFEDNYFSLLPGESRTVGCRPAKDGRSAEVALTAYTVEI